MFKVLVWSSSTTP